MIHIMCTISSIINVGNPHKGFESFVAKFYLAQLFDEQLYACTLSGLFHIHMLI
jgi:hypothetical protein